MQHTIIIKHISFICLLYMKILLSMYSETLALTRVTRICHWLDSSTDYRLGLGRYNSSRVPLNSYIIHRSEAPSLGKQSWHRGDRADKKAETIYIVLLKIWFLYSSIGLNGTLKYLLSVCDIYMKTLFRLRQSQSLYRLLSAGYRKNKRHANIIRESLCSWLYSNGPRYT